MTGHKGVIFALVRIGETAKTSHFPIGMKTVATPGQQFVTVGLMPHIPHNPVIRGAEHIVQCHGQLDSSHRRGKMPRISR